MAISAFEHPFLSGLMGDREIAALLGPEAEIAAMLRFEKALAVAEADHGVIPAEAAAAIATALDGLDLDIAALCEATAKDGVVVPAFVAQVKQAVGAPHERWVHFGATSQDVIDTALVLRLQAVARILAARLDGLDDALDDLQGRFGSRPLMGRTRMQAAIPIQVRDRVESWRAPLRRSRERLQEAASDVSTVQFGGAAGTLEKLGDRSQAVRDALAAELGLRPAPQWHSQRDRVAAFSDALSLVTGALGKMGQDMALLAQGGQEIGLSGGGASSAMPHKQNPVQAEILVSLARFNATQVAGMHHALVHEQERSGAALTLEWLILPQMVVATGAATRTARQLVGSVERLGGD